ncbi:MAG: hypothetical protein JKY56_19300, partial [Kofleriaceae bacterium]|nr:hypothetical protein [Kofleriaceae bacterium]
VREQCPALALHRTIGLARKHGAIVPFPASLARQAAQSGLAGLSVDYRGITPEFAEAVRSEGLQLAAWTVNEVRDLDSLSGVPITWIETDFPEAIVRTLANSTEHNKEL